MDRQTDRQTNGAILILHPKFLPGHKNTDLTQNLMSVNLTSTNVSDQRESQPCNKLPQLVIRTRGP